MIYLLLSRIDVIEFGVAQITLRGGVESDCVGRCHHHPLIIVDDVETIFLDFEETLQELFSTVFPEELLILEAFPRDPRDHLEPNRAGFVFLYFSGF